MHKTWRGEPRDWLACCRFLYHHRSQARAMCNSSKCLETLYTGKCQRANPSATSSLAVGLISEQRSDKLGIRGSPKARSKVLQQPFNR